jgi:hypothetical protein
MRLFGYGQQAFLAAWHEWKGPARIPGSGALASPMG